MQFTLISSFNTVIEQIKWYESFKILKQIYNNLTKLIFNCTQ